ncbi:MAG: fumarate reductase subunit FrdD [Succinivibrio sp.]|jgi:fumarate reductase subunit D|nr:fumarate reductase subunit FrdD [Succinivibrio sp.]
MLKILPTRSDEPIFWLMFGTGGMIAAWVLPAILVVMIVAGICPPGIDSGLLSFAQAKAILGNWFLALVLFGIVFILCMYALHRMYHSLHDLNLHSKIFWYICYGGAAALSFITLGLQLMIYCKLF